MRNFRDATTIFFGVLWIVIRTLLGFLYLLVFYPGTLFTFLLLPLLLILVVILVFVFVVTAIATAMVQIFAWPLNFLAAMAHIITMYIIDEPFAWGLALIGAILLAFGWQYSKTVRPGVAAFLRPVFFGTLGFSGLFAVFEIFNTWSYVNGGTGWLNIPPFPVQPCLLTTLSFNCSNLSSSPWVLIYAHWWLLVWFFVTLYKKWGSKLL